MIRIEPEFNPPRGPARAAWAAVAALLLAAGLAWGLAAIQAQRIGRLQTALLAARAAAQRPAAPPPAPPVYADSARELLAEHDASWQTTLLALERSAMQGVTPVRVDVQVYERSARVEVEFGDYAELLRYLDALNAGAAGSIAQWAIVSAQRPAGMAAAPLPSTAVLLRRW